MWMVFGSGWFIGLSRCGIILWIFLFHMPTYHLLWVISLISWDILQNIFSCYEAFYCFGLLYGTRMYTHHLLWIYCMDVQGKHYLRYFNCLKSDSYFDTFVKWIIQILSEEVRMRRRSGNLDDALSDCLSYKDNNTRLALPDIWRQCPLTNWPTRNGCHGELLLSPSRDHWIDQLPPENMPSSRYHCLWQTIRELHTQICIQYLVPPTLRPLYCPVNLLGTFPILYTHFFPKSQILKFK